MYSNAALYDSIKLLNIIPINRLDECQEIANSSNRDLHSVLLSHDLLSDINIGKLKADIYGVPFVRLSELGLTKEISTLIPQVYAHDHKCMALKKDKDKIVIACANPDDKKMIEQLNIRFGKKIKIVYATKRDIMQNMKIYADDPKDIFEKLLKSAEPPIIQIVDVILRLAYERGASDIHIEPMEEESTIRFRVDGVMHDIAKIPTAVHEQVVMRIKVLSSLRTDDNKGAQDGKLRYSVEDENVDVRVSLVPIVYGESIVLRLLSEKSRQFSLLDLGLSDTDVKKIDEARVKPHGMILATGPTGSGKTTTLYALLKLLNSREVNIMTIEDPVEYEIDGVSQIQVNKATNLTFADGLRSIVRQDPDIILVGEIRDGETAGIAVNSAMTGHLVLSTLHTNDAATTIPRLIDMEVEPFLIASTVNMIVAQRLVRKICPQCRASQEVPTDTLKSTLSDEIVAKYFEGPTTRLYKGQGCKSCQNLGYQGRVGIYEIMQITDAIKDAIVAKKDATEIQDVAIKDGMLTMLEDGLTKVKNGITTIEEILRVTKE